MQKNDFYSDYSNNEIRREVRRAKKQARWNKKVRNNPELRAFIRAASNSASR